jgi:hypothetical protein
LSLNLHKSLFTHKMIAHFCFQQLPFIMTGAPDE